MYQDKGRGFMKKILIIDSDVDFLNMMKGELEAAGYEVVVV